MAAITLLQKLQKLFGVKAVSSMMGNTSNVRSLGQGINNSLSGTFSKKYLQKNPEALEEAAASILESLPYAFGTKDARQIKNFENNVNTLFDFKFPQSQSEGKVIDLGSKQQVTGKGLESLKKSMGLPEGVDPNSPMGSMLSSTNRINKMGKDMETKAESAGDIFMDLMKSSAPPVDRKKEGLVRTAAREFLNREIKLGKIKLQPDEIKSITQPSGGGKDPIDILRTYYGEDSLEAFDGIANKFMNTEKYSDFNKIIDENIDPSFLKPRKDPTIKQSFTDKEMKDIVDEAEKDLGDRLKDLPDDIDPDALANGGRPGYGKGDLVVKGIPALKKLIKDKFGNKSITTADNVARPQSALDREMFDEANKRFNKKVNERTSAADNITPKKPKPKTPDKALLKAMDEIGGGTGDLKYDADVLADELAFQRGLIPEGGDITDIADQMKRMDLYDEAYSALSQQFLKNREIKKMKNLSKPTQTLKSIEDTGTINISDDEIMGEFETFMRERDPEGMKPIDALVEKINLKGKKRTDNAEGGRIGFSVGGAKVGMVGFQKLRDLIRNLAKERGMQGSDILKLMNYKNLASAIKSKFSKVDFDKFKLEIQESKMEQLERFKGMFESKVKFNKSIEQGKALDDGGTGMSDIFKYMDESFSKRSPVPKNVNEEDVLKMDQLIKNQTVRDDPRKLNAQGGLNYLMGL